MKNRLLDFWNNESGVVTINWIILAAAFVGVGIFTFAILAPGYNTNVRGNMDMLCDVRDAHPDADDPDGACD